MNPTTTAIHALCESFNNDYAGAELTAAIQTSTPVLNVRVSATTAKGVDHRVDVHVTLGVTSADGFIAAHDVIVKYFHQGTANSTLERYARGLIHTMGITTESVPVVFA